MKKDKTSQESLEKNLLDLKDPDKLPLRLQILAMAFNENLSSEEANDELIKAGCEKLYARSYYEASLIYAFDNHISYEEWQTLLDDCSDLLQDNSFFPGGKITLKQLEEYILKESNTDMRTAYITKFLEQSLTEQHDTKGFYGFMKDNIERFSSVREKARYYFCKYLHLYIQDKCDAYYKSCQLTDKVRHQFGAGLADDERFMQEKFALEELNFLKPLTTLGNEAKRVKPGMTPEEKRAYLDTTSLTPGGIFDEFNYFYFGYISTDWLEILFELYGDFAEWPKRTKIKIAHSLGLCSENPDASQAAAAILELERMADEQRQKEDDLDDLYSRDSEDKKKAYQKGRKGELYFRDFILGKVDIDRSTLISFLMFIDARLALPDESKLTRLRLNRILDACGFSQLRPDDEFDSFVLAFLAADDPIDILEEEVEKHVTKGNNFFLYQVYQNAYSHQKELIKYLV